MKSFQEFLNEDKSSKEEADYQAHPHKGQICENCTMWRPPNKCSAVAGDISPKGWCSYYKRSKRKDLN